MSCEMYVFCVYVCLRLLQILGRTSSQIKQMRKGLKETEVWPILSERKDVAEAVFPSGKEVICSPQVQYQTIYFTVPMGKLVFDSNAAHKWLPP